MTQTELDLTLLPRVGVYHKTGHTPGDDTQSAAILAYLEVGHSLTPLEALTMFGCFRLGARIWDLKAQGHKIATEMVAVGRGKRVARYRLLA